MQQHYKSYYPPDVTLTLPEASETLPWPRPTAAAGPILSYGGLFPVESHGFQCDVSRLQPTTTARDAKAIAASRSHSEAERRRREKINAHLAKLRTLLPSNTKTDKASLLAEVIQHVKDLKSHASELAETTIPPEKDELTVDSASYEHGRWIVKASICCDDRSDLLPDLIKTLKALRLRTLKAEITSLGGRVRNVLFITGEEECCFSLEEALKAVVEKTNGDSGIAAKRQRTNATAML